MVVGIVVDVRLPSTKWKRALFNPSLLTVRKRSNLRNWPFINKWSMERSGITAAAQDSKTCQAAWMALSAS